MRTVPGKAESFEQTGEPLQQNDAQNQISSGQETKETRLPNGEQLVLASYDVIMKFTTQPRNAPASLADPVPCKA